MSNHRLDIIAEAVQGLLIDEALTTDKPSHVSKKELSSMIEMCRFACFPEYYLRPQKEDTRTPLNDHLRSALQKLATILQKQLINGFLLQNYETRLKKMGKIDEVRDHHVAGAKRPQSLDDPYGAASKIVDEFLICRLAKVRVLLRLDIEAMFTHDVAADSISEIVLCYPSVVCMLHQRIAHELYILHAPHTVTRMITEMAHSLTGIDIHPQCTIGHHFFIDHGTGVVIGATAIIGNHVCIYQGVTLGARSFPIDPVTGEKIKNLPRHPIIEDYVTLYSNAVVLGRITVGRGSTVAGNVWVTQDVPPGTTVVQTKSKIVKGTGDSVFINAGDGI